MASYFSPGADEIQTLCGIVPLIEGTTEAAIEATINSLLIYAEATVALNVSETIFNSADLTDRKVTALQQATAYRTGALYLNRIKDFKLTGVNEPHDLEESSEFREEIAALEERAERIENLVSSGSPTVSFAFPRARSSTFTGTSTATPVERLMRLDEADDDQFSTDPDFATA